MPAATASVPAAPMSLWTSLAAWARGLFSPSQLRRALILLPAVAILSLGIALNIRSELGADIYTAFQEALGRHLGMTVGEINLAMNIVIVTLFLFLDRSVIGIGSVMMCLLIGPGINLWSALLYAAVPVLNPAVQALLCAGGILLISLALAWYIPLSAGVQPLDMLILTIARLVRKSYGIGNYIFNGLALVGALLLGGVLGLGTILNYICTGRLVDILIPRLRPLQDRLLRNDNP